MSEDRVFGVGAGVAPPSRAHFPLPQSRWAISDAHFLAVLGNPTAFGLETCSFPNKGLCQKTPSALRVPTASSADAESPPHRPATGGDVQGTRRRTRTPPPETEDRGPGAATVLHCSSRCAEAITPHGEDSLAALPARSGLPAPPAGPRRRAVHGSS